MKSKPHKCKGTGKAAGSGCGEMSSNRKYGLSLTGCKCYQEWLYSSDAGKEVLSKTTLRASKNVSKEKKKEHIAQKQDHINYSGKLQSKVQEIARLIDLGHKCLARDRMALSLDGGHVFGKGSHSECKFNLHNIFAQDSKSNQSTKEDQLMTEGLRREFGEDYFLFVENLKNKPIQKHSKPEIANMYKIACRISNKLIKEGRCYSKSERITLRNEFNLRIGYYPIELCVFDDI